jgi:hypothetical protein
VKDYSQPVKKMVIQQQSQLERWLVCLVSARSLVQFSLGADFILKKNKKIGSAGFFLPCPALFDFRDDKTIAVTVPSVKT